MRSYLTRQRSVIDAYLETVGDRLFSAPELARELKEKGVSQSAVYRNLAEMEKEARLVRVPREGEKTDFFRAVRKSECRRHLHLACKTCGKTFHLPLDATDRVAEAAREDAGFEIDREGTVLPGVCRECREKEKGGKER